jgi:hypothetical protein
MKSLSRFTKMSDLSISFGVAGKTRFCTVIHSKIDIFRGKIVVDSSPEWRR